ncbi:MULTISPECIES: amidase family protein [unclassified Rhodococcus (in: high G+C Gram-positive bacteria)]|uniref:amidase n=1 Tax=unclassified Rhodococcus (in: high G+C Gram-positive bacteria) TaxID=192944 RepID=UPI003393E25B
MTTNAVWTMSAHDIAEAVRRRDLSAREVLESHLDRIESVNGTVNALPVLLLEESRARADAIDASAEAPAGLLAGVPTVVKINTAVAGQPNTNGCPSLTEVVEKEDSWVVESLRRQGAVVVGMSNAPEFSLRWHTANPLFGATVNPHVPDRVAGGSSGGSAAAVATGMVPLAHGNDQGGSLRHPASCCGVVGLRPTIGLTPTDGARMSFGAKLFGVEGVISRNVKDAELGLRSMLSARPRGFPAPELRDDLLSSKRLRIGVIAQPAGAVSPEVASAIERAGTVFERSGAEVVQLDPEWIRDLEQTRGSIVYHETKAMWTAKRQLTDQATTLRSLEHMESYFSTTGVLSDYVSALNRLTELTARWHEFAADYDAILGPVSTEPPFEVEMDTGGEVRAHQVIDSMRFVTAISATGSPVVSAPVMHTAAGPIGIQIVAPLWRDYQCLQIANILEREIGLVAPVDPVSLSIPQPV